MSSFLKLPAKLFRFLKRRWKLISILLIILGIVAFFIIRQNVSKKTTEKFVHPEVSDVVQTLDVSGIIEAKEKAILRFAGGGKITYLGAKEGDYIKKGQVLARIDARELQKQLQQDLNVYFNERMDFEQGKDDRRDVASTNFLNRLAQKEQKDLENKVLDVEIQDIVIKNTVLSSPIEGVLVNAPITVPGITILATDTFEVTNPNTLVFRATVDQADVAKVKKAQPVSITLDPYPDETIYTKTSYIAYKSSQSSTGTVYVVEMPIPINFEFPFLEHYRLGMNGDAQIELDRHDKVLNIPLSATREQDGKTLVKVKVSDEKTEDREIKVGIENDTQVEVLSGLSKDDLVLVP